MIECMNKLKNKQLFEGCSCLYEESSQWEKVKSLFHQIACLYESVMVISTIIFIMFWGFLPNFFFFFFLPQVKRCAIITNKHGIYELPHQLPNDL